MRRIFLLLAVPLLLLIIRCGGGPPDRLLLFDFEEEHDLDRVVWKCHNLYSLSADWSASGERSLRCELGREQYPGVQFIDFERDWSRFDSLTVHIRSEAPRTLDLVIRVDDEKAGQAFENRYNGSFRLEPGVNRVAIPTSAIAEGPESRLLDLTRVRTFMIFIRNWNEPPVLYVDRIELD